MPVAGLLAARYAELLGNIEGLGLPFEPDWARSNWQSYCVRLPDRVDQKAVMQSLLDQGIATRRGIMCSHREAPYSGEKQRHDLRQSEARAGSFDSASDLRADDRGRFGPDRRRSSEAGRR